MSEPEIQLDTGDMTPEQIKRVISWHTAVLIKQLDWAWKAPRDQISKRVFEMRRERR